MANPGERHAEILAQLLKSAGTAGNLTTDAHLAAMERARALNAHVPETPEQARGQAKAADPNTVDVEAKTKH